MPADCNSISEQGDKTVPTLNCASLPPCRHHYVEAPPSNTLPGVVKWQGRFSCCRAGEGTRAGQSLDGFTRCAALDRLNIYLTPLLGGEVTLQERSASSNWLKCSGLAFTSCFQRTIMDVHLRGKIWSPLQLIYLPIYNPHIWTLSLLFNFTFFDLYLCTYSLVCSEFYLIIILKQSRSSQGKKCLDCNMMMMIIIIMIIL